MKKDSLEIILILICLILSTNSRKLLQKEELEQITPTPDNVKLIGRYYQDEDEEVIWLIQSGSAIEFYVTGSTLELVLVGDNYIEADEDMRPRYGIYLDDKEIEVDTMNDEEYSIKVFEDEEEETHKIKVMLLSENMFGGVGIKSINVASTAKKIIKPVENKKMLIEFIGDSITCGYGVEGKDQNEHFKTITENFAKSYAYFTAQALDADYSAVSYSGYGIVSGYSTGEKNAEEIFVDYYELNGKNKNYRKEWDFEIRQPDWIVINLGTNDNNYVLTDPDTRKNEFMQGYTNLLLNVREHNPNANILCTLGVMGATGLFPLIETSIKKVGDQKIFTYLLPKQNMQADGLGSDWHPSEKTQIKISKLLVEKLKELIGEKSDEGDDGDDTEKGDYLSFLATSKNVKLIGRYYQNDGVTWLIQSGSAIEFYATGSYASIEIVGDDSINAEENHRPRFAIFLDDQPVEDVIISKETNKYKLFEVNEDKTFKIKVILLSENKYGGVGVKNINLVTNVKDGAIIPTSRKKMLIEFIGDSITCGFGVEGDKEEDFKTETENFMKSYAYLTAQLLDADYTSVCYSGHGVVSGLTRVDEKNDKDLVPNYYSILGKNENYQGDWDFKNHQPDFIVINLGTNDNTYVRYDPDTRNDEFVEEYSNFLKTVREKNPKANIICTLGTMWATELYPLIVKAVKSFGDSKMTSYQSETQLEEDGIGPKNHPSALTHQKSANLLVKKINEILNKQLPTGKTQSISLTEENVKIIGRYYKNKDGIWLVQSGSAVEFYLTAKFGEIVLLGDSAILNDEDYRPRYGVYVDDEPIEIDLLNDKEHEVILFDEEEINTKKIKIMLLSENTNGGIGVKIVNIISTVQNPIIPVEKKELLIEFIGDSITCAYGVEGKDQNEHFKTSTENFSKSYAYLTAQALDADYTTVAYSGHGIISGFSAGEKNEGALMPELYTKISKHENYEGDWDFKNHQPDIIVINLGTNDLNYFKGDPEIRGDDFTQEYSNFLDLVREKNPDAYIICTIGILGATEIYPYIETAITLTGDDRISSYQAKTQDMSDGLGSDWHPSSITHKKASEELISKIKKILN